MSDRQTQRQKQIDTKKYIEKEGERERVTTATTHAYFISPSSLGPIMYFVGQMILISIHNLKKLIFAISGV